MALKAQVGANAVIEMALENCPNNSCLWPKYVDFADMDDLDDLDECMGKLVVALKKHCRDPYIITAGLIKSKVLETLFKPLLTLSIFI